MEEVAADFRMLPKVFLRGLDRISGQFRNGIAYVPIIYGTCCFSSSNQWRTMR
jgi:hypothetical protein